MKSLNLEEEALVAELIIIVENTMKVDELLSDEDNVVYSDDGGFLLSLTQEEIDVLRRAIKKMS